MHVKFNIRYFILIPVLLLCFNIIKAYQPEKIIPANKKAIIYKFEIKQEIGPSIWRQTIKAFNEAKKLKCDVILIHMNTYGGTLDDADSIRTRILNSKIPVYVFIDNNAASAGALISIACSRIYMRKGASIGAATVVTQTGEAAPDKYQAYMRSMMRATAESHGKQTIITGNDTITKWFRDPHLAEAMVDQRIYIKGINDSGKVITFTTLEAIKYGYCEGQAENISEVLQKCSISNYKIITFQPTFIDRFIGFLVNPIVHGILIMLIVGGIYYEFQTPGATFPISAAILGAILFFAPLYLEGLAANWEIALFILGVVLIGLEIFVIPGFGFTGITGVILVITGLTLSMVKNNFFDFGIDGIYLMFKSLFIVTFSMFAALALSIYFSKKLFSSAAFGNLALNTVQNRDMGYISSDLKQNELIGQCGTADTVLRPAGKVDVNGTVYDATAIVGFINKGEKVKVIKYETGQLYVVLSD
jgi:membrane-bound serine protease (ClpP class)